jgi:hypothetical protein
MVFVWHAKSVSILVVKDPRISIRDLSLRRRAGRRDRLCGLFHRPPGGAVPLVSETWGPVPDFLRRPDSTVAIPRHTGCGILHRSYAPPFCFPHGEAKKGLQLFARRPPATIMLSMGVNLAPDQSGPRPSFGTGQSRCPVVEIPQVMHEL